MPFGFFSGAGMKRALGRMNHLKIFFYSVVDVDLMRQIVGECNWIKFSIKLISAD